RDRYSVISQQLYRRVRTVRCQTKGMSGCGDGFVDAIIKKCVLIMKNRSGNGGVLERQDRAVALVVDITIDASVSGHQKIPVPSQTKVIVNKGVTKSASQGWARCQCPGYQTSGSNPCHCRPLTSGCAALASLRQHQRRCLGPATLGGCLGDLGAPFGLASRGWQNRGLRRPGRGGNCFT